MDNWFDQTIGEHRREYVLKYLNKNTVILATIRMSISFEEEN